MKTIKLFFVLLFSFVVSACGGGGGGGGPEITTLMWSVSPSAIVPPTAGSVIAGQTALYKFTFPNDSSGDPSAQIAVSSGDVAAYLCSTADCGQGKASLNSLLSITAAGQVYVTSPGAVTVYYVAIYGNSASNYTIQATGT